MNDDTRKNNIKIFYEKLNSIGINTELLQSKYGEKLENGSFCNTDEYNKAYDGSLIETVLRTLTPYAVRINELLPSNARVPKEKLVKICLLHQISKCIRMVRNDNAWEIEKRGIVYKYVDALPSIRTGLHSLSMALDCGIVFSDDEIEAMTSIDRDLTDQQYRYHCSTLSTILRQANELTYTEFKETKTNEHF